jgi:tetratricopeptide (TPR) repeat protein
MNRRRSSPIRSAICSLMLFAGVVAGADPAWAIDKEQALSGATQQVRGAVGDMRGIEETILRSRTGQRSASQMVGDAVLLMASRDWERAATVLNKVIEKYPDHPTAYPEAMALLSEAYYSSNQYLATRRAARKIIERGLEPRFAQYQVSAIEKLVDVAMRIREDRGLDEIFVAMNRLPAQSVTSGIMYARGKALILKKDWAGARQALVTVDPQSKYLHQAGYLLGLVAMKEAMPPPAPVVEGAPPPRVPKQRYVPAIDMFYRVTKLPADTPEHAHVIDLAWLAIGRLFHETDDLLQAVDAYNHINRSSPEFGTALYELGWVYVRLGDMERAQRALEILAVADPKSKDIADGLLLRADLMLRAGQFEKALRVYEGVRAEYDPVNVKIDNFLRTTGDPSVYFDKLSRTDTGSFDSTGAVPLSVVQWAREEENGPAAAAIVDSLVQCRKLIKQSNEMIRKLSVVISSSNRVRAFPDLKAGEERALGLVNRIGIARLTIGQGLDAAEPSDLAGEIGAARARRRSLEKRMRMLPVNDADFLDREAQAMRQWNVPSQTVQRMSLELDVMETQIKALRRVLRDSSKGTVRDPAIVQRFELELQQHEKDIEYYRNQVQTLERVLSAGKMQVGFGDQRFVEDAQVRIAYRDAVVREVQLAMGGAGGNELADYARRSAPILQEAEEGDKRILAAFSALEQEVARRTTEVRAIMEHETVAMVGYEVELERLDREARGVVGEVARRNFGIVRDRLHNIVLRADVGITEQAWEVREEQMTRVRSLRVERSREEKLLKEELDEVLEDSASPEEKPK